MVTDNLDNERGNPLVPFHGLFFLISNKGSFISNIPDRIVHMMVFVVEYRLECEIV